MSKLHNTIRVKASPDITWQVLGDLSRANEWIPGIVTAQVEGTRRVCTTGDGFEIHEEISDCSNAKRSFRYLQTQVPLPVKNSRGEFSVAVDGDGSMIVWDTEFDVLDSSQEAQVTSMIDGYYKQSLESLCQHIEATPK